MFFPFPIEVGFSDQINPVAISGFILRQILESPAEDSRYWQDSSYLSGTDGRLLDWNENPRAALPVWLTVALQRPAQ